MSEARRAPNSELKTEEHRGTAKTVT